MLWPRALVTIACQKVLSPRPYGANAIPVVSWCGIAPEWAVNGQNHLDRFAVEKSAVEKHDVTLPSNMVDPLQAVLDFSKGLGGSNLPDPCRQRQPAAWVAVSRI